MPPAAGNASTPPFLRGKSGSLLAAVALTLAGAVISVALAIYARHNEDERILGNFRERAVYQLYATQERIRLVEEVVYGLRGIINGQHSVDRSEFARVSADVFDRIDGLQSLQWVEIVPHAKRAAFEATATAETGATVVIKQRRPDGVLVPADVRDSYIVIRFAEPMDTNRMVIGYDITTSPTVDQLVSAARSGELRVSPAFRIAQARDDAEDFGIIFILPVYSHDTPTSLRGYVQTVFRVGPMLSTDLEDEALQYFYLDLDAPTPASRLLYSSRGDGPAGRFAQPPEPGAPGTYEQTVVVGDRQWRFIAVMDPVWRAAQRSRQPILILLGGFALTAVTASLLLALLRRARVVEQIVADRTRALRTSEGELRAILDNSPNAIWIKSLDGRYLLVNREFSRDYRRLDSSLIGCSDDDLFPPEVAAAMRAIDDRVVNENRDVVIEDEWVVVGERRRYLVVKFPVRDAVGRIFGVGGIATDITNLKKVERQLAETQKLESLGVLAGGIAHDFNNLLTGVLGNASLISLDHPAHSETGQAAAEIVAAARQAAELCGQMLAYSGRANFVLKSVDVSAAVRDVIPLLRSAINKRTELQLDLAGNLPPVEADPAQLRQIIMNLVINGSEALADSGGSVTVRTQVRDITAEELLLAIGKPELPSGRYVQLSVEDTGCGIPPETLQRIFEPFFTTKFTGRGLGLSAVLGIVRGHRGALFVHTWPGRGTRFELLLPLAATPTATADQTRKPGAASTLDLTGKRVLVAEDEAVVRRLVDRVLTEAGARVGTTQDGREAIGRFAPGEFDLLVLDLTMPGCSGLEVMAHARKLEPGLRVLLISGYSADEAAGCCGETRPDGFLKKPFSAEDLVAAVKSVLSAPAPAP